MFIDTNVFVSARFPTAEHHLDARTQLEAAFRSGERLCISRQIIREYLVTVTRPQSWGDPLPVADTLRDVQQILRNYWILENNMEVTSILLDLFSQVRMGGKLIHDANIVATMLAHGERRLLTFNANDFKRFDARIDLVR